MPKSSDTTATKPKAAKKPSSARTPNSKATKPELKPLEGYLAELAYLDVPLPVKIELVRALRQIMQSFVDRAFGDDPAQLARPVKDDPN